MVEAAYLGDAGTGAELIEPLRRLGPQLDTFAVIPPSALGQLHIDPDEPVPSVGDGAFLADFPAAAIDALVAVAGPDADTQLGSVGVRHLGGALARPVPGVGAGGLGAKLLLDLVEVRLIPVSFCGVTGQQADQAPRAGRPASRSALPAPQAGNGVRNRSLCIVQVAVPISGVLCDERDHRPEPSEDLVHKALRLIRLQCGSATRTRRR